MAGRRDRGADRQKETLKKRQQKLEKSVGGANYWFYSLLGIGFLLFLGSSVWLWSIRLSPETSQRGYFTPLSLVTAGAVLLCFSPLAANRRRAWYEQLQNVEFELDLLQVEASDLEIRAEKLLRIQELQLRRYYNQNLGQNKWVFCLGIFCITIGAAIAFVTLYYLSLPRPSEDREGKYIIGVLGAISTILTSYIGKVFLDIYAGVNGNLQKFHDRLASTYELFVAYLLLSRIDDVAVRHDTLSKLALSIRQHKADGK